MGTGKLRYAETAKRLDVTKSELRKFITTKPDTLRRTYNRHPEFTKLYGSKNAVEQRREVRQRLGVKRITRYPYDEGILRRSPLIPGRGELEKSRSRQIGHMIQNLYYANNVHAQDWSEWTYENELPNNPKLIGHKSQTGSIPPAKLRQAINRFKRDYPEANWMKAFGLEADYYDEEAA